MVANSLVEDFTNANVVTVNPRRLLGIYYLILRLL